MYLPLIYLDVRKKLSEWMKEFFPPPLATLLNVILPIWPIIQLFRIKQPQPLKVTPILLNLNKWYHHWHFFVQKCTKYQMVCHPCEEKYETSLFKNDDSNKDTKMWTKFFFWLECWCVSQTTKGTFLIIKEKKYIEKKRTFLLFLLLSSYRFLALRFQKNTTLPFEIIFSCFLE